MLSFSVVYGDNTCGRRSNKKQWFFALGAPKRLPRSLVFWGLFTAHGMKMDVRVDATCGLLSYQNANQHVMMAHMQSSNDFSAGM